MSAEKFSRPINVIGSPAACQQPPMKQPTDPAPRTATRGASATTAIRSDALIGHPQAFRRLSRLPEDVDRHSAARIPIAADAEPSRLHLARQTLADPHRDVLVKAAMVAVRP